MKTPLTDSYARLCLTDDRAGPIEHVTVPYAECASIERLLWERIANLQSELASLQSRIQNPEHGRLDAYKSAYTQTHCCD